MDKTTALLIIDYTNDFVADEGALTTGTPGQKLEDEILKLANSFIKNDNLVILPTDLHKKDEPFHPETKLFPPHNLKDSWGHELYGEIQNWYTQNADRDQVYYFDKNRYSAFVNTNLDNYLRTHKIDTLLLTGVCTDICILQTAISAYNLNYKIRIDQKAVASFDPIGHEWAISHFKNCLGAEIF